MKSAVVLVAHGTVDSLDDLPEFLTNIRRGHPPSAELVAEMRRRYEAIGGRSPLNAINRTLAGKLAESVGFDVVLANRLSKPYPKDVLAQVAAGGAKRIAVVPLAQHSAAVYGEAMKVAAREVDPLLEILCAPNWGRTRELTEAFVSAVVEALARVPEGERARAAVVFTAHSLPRSVIEAGDPYEAEFRASASDVMVALRARGIELAEHAVAFQSQGMSKGAWLGPDLQATLEGLAGRGRKHVVVAPIGFLADHVEILYDLDIEAKAWSAGLGLVLYRSNSLNDARGLVDALTVVVKGLFE